LRIELNLSNTSALSLLTGESPAVAAFVRSACTAKRKSCTAYPLVRLVSGWVHDGAMKLRSVVLLLGAAGLLACVASVVRAQSEELGPFPPDRIMWAEDANNRSP
jgi:hypothetical protein